MSLASINWLAVLVGVVFSNVIGFLWYGPLFGQMWLKMIGKRAEDIKAEPTMYLKTIVVSAVTLIVLNLIVRGVGASSVVDGLVNGAVVSVGIGSTVTYLYTSFEGPPTNVWFLNAIYQLLVFLVMGAVFAIWT